MTTEGERLAVTGMQGIPLDNRRNHLRISHDFQNINIISDEKGHALLETYPLNITCAI